MTAVTDEQKLEAIKEALGKAVWDALETGGIDLLKATSMFLSNHTAALALPASTGENAGHRVTQAEMTAFYGAYEDSLEMQPREHHQAFYDGVSAAITIALTAADAHIAQLEAQVDLLNRTTTMQEHEREDMHESLCDMAIERDEARKALEPFARAMVFWDSNFPEATDDAFCDAGDCTVGDLRRARAVVGSGKE